MNLEQSLRSVFGGVSTWAWGISKGLITATIPSARTLRNVWFPTILVGSSFFGFNSLTEQIAPISKAVADIVLITGDARLASNTNSELLSLHDADTYKSSIQFDTADAVLTDSGTFGTSSFHEYMITGTAHTRIFNSAAEQIAEAQASQFRLTINNFVSGGSFSGNFEYLFPEVGSPHLTGDITRAGFSLSNLDTGVTGSDLDAFISYGLDHGFDDHDGLVDFNHLNLGNGDDAALADSTTGYQFSVTAVPEPSSLIPVAVAAGGLLLRRRRKDPPDSHFDLAA